MNKEIWLNLPVKNLNRSREFFRNIGLKLHPYHEQSDDRAGILIGEIGTMIMLFPQDIFARYAGQAVSDSTKGTEVLISLAAASPEEVEEMAEKAKQAGADLFAPPAAVETWMYGCAFADLDGHRWNIVYMEQ